MEGRWDDWVALAAGVGAAVSWIWHGMFGVGMVAMFLLGLAVMLTAVMSVTRPGMIAGEAVMLALGTLMFCAPWLLGFADRPAAAWTAWVLGALVAAMGAVGLPLSGGAHRRPVPH
ncbi:SPW repeat protein [Actinorugispora endophytica]|uniref:SPW repeat-containing protein n=1 Tax=Actinorugispora endophytica TaxID=1605990 RepID=A0A4R6V6L4_9ACTN|nr:SPW repeat protein [Actinorugispora endophytica]TDQ54729.1 SPW repeat-containing protein [Actinorugispora endophytica]